jgi:hypothetical protein
MLGRVRVVRGANRIVSWLPAPDTVLGRASGRGDQSLNDLATGLTAAAKAAGWELTVFHTKMP